METWKDIPYYEGIYEASNVGRIRSKENKETSSARFQHRIWKQRIMKFSTRKRHLKEESGIDYLVTLWKDGKPHKYLVSRLIASTFIKNNLFTNLTVNHKDGNPLNNKVENLEWVTRADNIRHGFASGLYKSVCKATTLKSKKGKTFIMNSFSDTDKFLNQYRGYTSRMYKSNSNSLKSKSGKIYDVTF